MWASVDLGLAVLRFGLRAQHLQEHIVSAAGGGHRRLTVVRAAAANLRLQQTEVTK